LHEALKRLTHDRVGEPWWKLAIGWGVLIGFLSAIDRGLDRQLLWILLASVGFVWYYWPSLNWVGIVLTGIGTAVALFVSMLAGPVAHSTAPDQRADAD
jgi:hypothetical protein